MSIIPFVVLTVLLAGIAAWCIWTGQPAILIVTRPLKHALLLFVAFVITFTLFGFIFSGVINLKQLMTPVTDVRQYNMMMSKAGNSPLFAHLPRTIPADAWNVHMYFDHGLLQAATMLQLRYATTPAQIAALSARFTPKAVVSFARGEETDIPHAPSFLTADKSTASQDTGFGDFPPDYQILVLYKDPTGDWNHNAFSGVAISKQRSEIVYWMEDW